MLQHLKYVACHNFVYKDKGGCMVKEEKCQFHV